MARTTASQMTAETIPTYVERTDLPRIMVRAKGGAVRYTAYVDGYIRGPKIRVKDTMVVPLYYVSLVDMNGDGGKLQGVWAALISQPPQDVYIETVGTVVLAHHDPQFQSLGYTLHWNYDQASTNDRENSLHAVIESNMLTMFDPVQGTAQVRRERKQKKTTHHGQASKRKSRTPVRVTQTTATKKELGDLEERTNREKHPLFLLMVPGMVPPARGPEEPEEAYAARRTQEVTTYLAEQHFAFLDLRVPQPLSIQWADFLWQRATATMENMPLTAWFKSVVQHAHEDEQDDEEAALQNVSLPVFCEAWLCRPNIARLDADRRQARLEGRISDLRTREEGDISQPVIEERIAVTA